MLSIIVIISGDQPDRHLNLELLLDCLNTQEGINSRYLQLILVEHTKEPDKAKFADMFATRSYINRHRFIKGAATRYIHVVSDAFHPGWLRNIGAKESTEDILLFLNSDVTFGPDYLSKLGSQFDSAKKFLVGWSRQIKLSRLGRSVYTTENFYSDNWKDIFVDLVIQPSFDGAVGCPIVIDRTYFYNVLGGFSENYFDCGDESDLLMRAYLLTGSFPVLDYITLHLWHPDWMDQIDPQFTSLISQAKRYPLELSTRMVHSNLGKKELSSPIDYKVVLVGR